MQIVTWTGNTYIHYCFPGLSAMRGNAAPEHTDSALKHHPPLWEKTAASQPQDGILCCGREQGCSHTPKGSPPKDAEVNLQEQFGHQKNCFRTSLVVQWIRQGTRVWSLVRQDPGRRNLLPTPVFLLENPVARGAWKAAVHRVAQSRTRLKWLSSSNSQQDPTCAKHLSLCATTTDPILWGPRAATDDPVCCSYWGLWVPSPCSTRRSHRSGKCARHSEEQPGLPHQGRPLDNTEHPATKRR